MAVGGEEAALDKPAFPGQGLNALGPQDIGMGQVFREIDASGPVLGSWKRSCLDDGDAESRSRQADGRGQPGSAGADDYHIEMGRGHEILPRPDVCEEGIVEIAAFRRDA